MRAETRLGLLLIFTLPAGAAQAKPIRLVTITPSATELVFELGKGGDVVAVSQMSEYPAAAKQLPSIGAMFMPSIERVLHFTPDWIVFDAAVPNLLFESAVSAVPIRKQTLSVFSVADLFNSAARFLETVYHEPVPFRVSTYHRCLDELASAPKSEHYSFLAFAWISPAFLFGQASFLSDVIRQTGGENALPVEWKSPYPQISEEWILSHPVDRVFYLSNSPGEEERAKVKIAEWWPGKKVRLVMLSWAHFARTSFAPFEALEEITRSESTLKFRQCLGRVQ